MSSEPIETAAAPASSGVPTDGPYRDREADSGVPGPSPLEPLVLTVDEVATLLRMSRSAAYEAVRRGEIPSRRIGRRILIPTPLLSNWLGFLPPTPSEHS